MLSADTRQKQRLATSLTYTPISPPLSTGFQTNQDCKLQGGGRIAGAASIASLATDECEDGQAIPPTFVGSSCREPVKESKASHLAVQLDGASQLLGSFAAGPQAVWRRVEVDGIQPYYWNEETGVSSWSRPDVPKPRSEDLPRVELDELTKPWIEDRVCSKGDGALPCFSEISKSKTPLWKQPLPTRTFPLMSRTKRLEPARKDPSPSKAAGLKDGAKPSSDETDDSTLGPSGLPESSTSPPPSRGKSQPSDAPASALGSSATPRSPSQNQTAAPPAPRQQSPKKPKPASARRGGKLHEELESKLSELREDDEEMQKLRSRIRQSMRDLEARRRARPGYKPWDELHAQEVAQFSPDQRQQLLQEKRSVKERALKEAAQRRSALQESKFAVRQAAIGADPDETFSPRLITRSSRERRSHSVDGTELAGAQKFGSVAPSRREIARRLAAEARVRCP